MRRSCTALSILLLASCGIPATEEDAAREERFRLQAVCVAYHDARGLAQLDTADAEAGEAHLVAMEVCDQVEGGM